MRGEGSCASKQWQQHLGEREQHEHPAGDHRTATHRTVRTSGLRLPVHLLGAEVIHPGPFEKLLAQHERTVLVAADIAAAIDEITRLTGSHLALLVLVASQEPVDESGIVSEAACLHVLPEDTPISLRAGRLDREAVAEPA